MWWQTLCVVWNDRHERCLVVVFISREIGLCIRYSLLLWFNKHYSFWIVISVFAISNFLKFIFSTFSRLDSNCITDSLLTIRFILMNDNVRELTILIWLRTNRIKEKNHFNMRFPYWVWQVTFSLSITDSQYLFLSKMHQQIFHLIHML